ncbi:serine acetyltransferase [Mycolicibacterium sp. P1-18]|nr:serine acetyltransferase [Mycolicibacterium sp. P1-18]
MKNRQDYVAFLQEDLHAHGVDTWQVHYRLTRPTLHFQRLLRRVEFLRSKRSGFLLPLRIGFARVRLARASVRLGISIPPGVFGRGLSIAHYGSIVVNDHAHVGKYCRIHSATNIGVADGGAPTLGDYVYIGPGAVIFGPITIGDDVVVAANAVVGKSFGGPGTLGGVPARAISRDGSHKVMPHWMPRRSARL